MSPSQKSLSACPEHEQLRALAAGKLADDEASRLDRHLASCRFCEATLDLFEEDSDTLVRSLATVSETTDDEPAFQRIHASLLANPERFSAFQTEDLTEALAGDATAGLSIPFRLGSYELLEQIGAGAHGAVFRARHLRLEKPVAIKLLVHTGGQAVDDFLQEMRVIGRLDHPHIIRATDAGEMDGIYFLVMEFVPGLDVSSLLRRVGPLSVRDACEVTRQAALGLAFAHQHHLVHRDVKTSNLLFTASGQIKLLDLGLATIASARKSGAELELPMPRGTADYMAPEQWRQSDLVDARADLYSLGCTLYKLLTGAAPFRRLPDGIESTREAHMRAPIPSLRESRREVPAALDQLVKGLLAKEAPDRPASAERVAQQIERFAAGADLGALAQRVFPKAVIEESLPEGMGQERARFPARRWLTRRNVVLGALAAAATGALLVPRRSGRLATDRWRSVELARPAFLTLPGIEPPELQERALGELDVESPGLALIHLGRPLRTAFRWRSSLRREDWSEAAGIFFRFQLRDPNGTGAFEFHSLEMQAAPKGGAFVRWKSYRVPTDPSRDAASLVLADAAWPPLEPDRTYTLEVTLGRMGFPEVIVDGRSLPESAWEVSPEARDLIFTSPAQIRVSFLGRIGLLQTGGRTMFGPSQLMYLDR